MTLARRTPLRTDPAKVRDWQRRSRKPLARGCIKPMSNERRAENRVRRRILHATYGQNPPCALCEPLQAHGIVTGCNGWADDGDEILRRSAGGSITDVSNVRPVGRRCHDWITTHPAEAREWGLEARR